MPNKLEAIELCLGCVTLTLLITGVMAECPTDYYQSDVNFHRCYSFVVGAQTWQNASRHCSKANGWLVTMDSEPKQENIVRFVTSTRPPLVEKVWIGLINTKTEWTWLNGGYLFAQGCFLVDDGGSDSAPFNYTTRQRSSFYTPTSCVAECSRNGSLFSGLVRVSEREMECRCADIFTPNISAVVPCSWKCPSDERQYCGANWEEDKEEKKAVLVFRNKDGINSQLNLWARGQPNNLYPYYDPYQACLTVINSTDTSDLRWADENCGENVYDADNRPYSHLCEYQLDTQHTTPEAACNNLSGHLVRLTRNGVISYRCYTRYYQSALSWFAARNDCRSRGGDLLSLDVQEVYDSLTSVLSSHQEELTRWWIGGRNEIWSWVDGGREAGYTYWGYERPQDGDNECVVMDYNSTPTRWRWVEEACGAQHAFMCETLDSNFPVPSSTPPRVQLPSSSTSQSIAGVSFSSPTLSVKSVSSSPSSKQSSSSNGGIVSAVSTVSNSDGIVSPDSSASATSLYSNFYSTSQISEVSTQFAVSHQSSSRYGSSISADMSGFNSTAQSKFSTWPLVTVDEFNRTDAKPGAGFTSNNPVDPGVIISIAFVSVTMAVTFIRTIVACAAGKSDSADFF